MHVISIAFGIENHAENSMGHLFKYSENIQIYINCSILLHFILVTACHVFTRLIMKSSFWRRPQRNFRCEVHGHKYSGQLLRYRGTTMHVLFYQESAFPS